MHVILNDKQNNHHTCNGRTGSPSIVIVPMIDENKLVIDASNSKRPLPGAALAKKIFQIEYFQIFGTISIRVFKMIR